MISKRSSKAAASRAWPSSAAACKNCSAGGLPTRFAGHPLLGEVRLHGGDLGVRFYESNVRDAIYALEAWRPAAQQSGTRDRLLGRVYKLRDELLQRAQAETDWGGHETLLH